MPGGKCNSKDEIRKYFERFLKAFEKFNVRETRPPAVSGDTVTHEYMADGKLKGGPEASVSAVAVAEFRNGRITQLRNYVDKLEAAKQMAQGTVAKRIVRTVAKRVEALVNP
jgi:ketosteroid isomerase-like protein